MFLLYLNSGGGESRERVIFGSIHFESWGFNIPRFRQGTPCLITYVTGSFIIHMSFTPLCRRVILTHRLGDLLPSNSASNSCTDLKQIRIGRAYFGGVLYFWAVGQNIQGFPVVDN
ncbi:hypothetical protein BD779DRAFT_461838 [Infundibulicybe gibba]|nr:hypothetical protein BD779DRAFT_461838 [Infundibulicybe gibba]